MNFALIPHSASGTLRGRCPKTLKRRKHRDQNEQNRLKRLGARSLRVHLKIGSRKSAFFFDHFHQLHFAIMKDGKRYLGHYITHDCFADENLSFGGVN